MTRPILLKISYRPGGGIFSKIEERIFSNNNLLFNPDT